MSTRKIIERYNAEAKTYNGARLCWIEGYLGKIEEKTLLEFLSGDFVLELGVGTGRLSSFLSKRGCEAIGIDVSKNMLKIAGERAGHEGLNVALIVADAHKLPIRKKSVDNIVCSRSFKFFKEPIVALEEAHRVLRKGGRFILSLETEDILWVKLALKLGLRTKETYENIYHSNIVIKMLQKTGFKVTHKMHLFSFPYAFYCFIDRKFPRFLKTLKKVDGRIGGWFSIIVSEV